MRTERIAEQYEFEAFDGRRVVAASDGGSISTEAGALLLRHADRAISSSNAWHPVLSTTGRQNRWCMSFPRWSGSGSVGSRSITRIANHDQLSHDPVHHLLSAKLRPANNVGFPDGDGAAGAIQDVARIVAQIRGRWPRVEILLRADASFAYDDMMSWCEANGQAGAPLCRLHLFDAQELKLGTLRGWQSRAYGEGCQSALHRY